MAKMVVHWDGTTAWLEGLAADSPIPVGLPVINDTQIPDKPQLCDWDGTRLVVNPTKRAQHVAKDRRSPQQKLIDTLIQKGVITADDVK